MHVGVVGVVQAAAGAANGAESDGAAGLDGGTVQADVTILTPHGSPGVADDPVIVAEFFVVSVAHHLDGVIDPPLRVVAVLRSVLEHTGLVVLPVASSDRDGKGANGSQGRHGSLRAVGSNGTVSADTSLAEVGVPSVGSGGVLGADVLALGGRLSAGVGKEVNERVGPLLGQAALGGVDVSIGQGSVAATASVASRGAGGDLLSREHSGLASKERVVGLNRLSGGMTPAISARPLMLHVRKNARGGPGAVIHLVGQGNVVVANVDGERSRAFSRAECLVVRTPLIGGHVAELIHTLLPGVGAISVVHLNVLQLAKENILAHVVSVSSTLVGLAEVPNVLLKAVSIELVPLGTGSSQRHKEGDCNQQDCLHDFSFSLERRMRAGRREEI